MLTKKLFIVLLLYCSNKILAQSDSIQLENDTIKIEEASIIGYSATQRANRQAYNVVALDTKIYIILPWILQGF